MAEVDIKSFDPQEFRLFQQMGSCSQHFNEDFIFSEESMNVETPQILDKGLMEYGYGSVPVCLAKFNSFLPLYLLNMSALSSDACTIGEGAASEHLAVMKYLIAVIVITRRR